MNESKNNYQTFKIILVEPSTGIALDLTFLGDEGFEKSELAFGLLVSQINGLDGHSVLFVRPAACLHLEFLLKLSQTSPQTLLLLF